MTLTLRIFLAYFLILGAATYYLVMVISEEIKPAMRQSSEETLIDISNLLAELVSEEFQSTDLTNSKFAQSVDAFVKRKISMDIYSIKKNSSDFRIYITDKNGIVRYHSHPEKWGHLIGADYSQWNDVYLTLRGKYGARSTPDNPNNKITTVMYVASPIKRNGEIIGVLTVGKNTGDVQPFINAVINRIKLNGLMIIIISVMSGAILAYWLTSSIRKLTLYAEEVSKGKKAILPNIKENELALLGSSMEKMREELEGKNYVEQYAHALTHEFKSPIASISGAAEILNKDMSAEDFDKFKGNIERESKRMTAFINRLLDLVKLEKIPELDAPEKINLSSIIQDIINAKQAIIQEKKIKFIFESESGMIKGDSFLINQCFDNIIQNAIEFSPFNSAISINIQSVLEEVRISIADNGTGIPDYAKDKVFDRFYSLARPDTQLKSTGIGLSFVKQILQLHSAQIEISDNQPKGTIVTCIFKAEA